MASINSYTIKLAHLNARSLTDKPKLAQLEQCMKSNDIDILAVTETRQLMQLGKESKRYWYVQSPPSGTGESLAQGVLLIIAKSKCIQA